MQLVADSSFSLALLLLEESGGTPMEHVLAASIAAAISGLALLAWNKPD